jgi:hypothetical protein
MRVLEEPTAVNLASFDRLCQQQKLSFHRFFAVFSGFFRFLRNFEQETERPDTRKTPMGKD